MAHQTDIHLNHFSKAKRALITDAIVAGFETIVRSGYVIVNAQKPNRSVTVWESGWCSRNGVDLAVAKQMTLAETRSFLGL